jgi:crotonobetainyl-CoA:carnitine CoA-transferase CaiB-like acyl-CoA transferase
MNGEDGRDGRAVDQTLGPLAGVRVVELTGYIAGPGVGMVLRDLGADVIKVEPLRGDAARAMGPYGDAIWSNYNRNKRSIALDVADPTGNALAMELIRRSDVLIQNLRPGAMDRLSFSTARLMKECPSLVYLSVTGYRSGGPNAHRLGFDVASQAESGMMSITGERGGYPLRIGYPVVDVVSTHIGAEAVLAALLGRSRTGKGTAIEVPMFDVAVHLQNVPLGTFLALGIEPQRTGNGQPYNAPSADIVNTQDGQLVISAYPNDHWRRLCEVIERPDLATDERFATNEARVANRPAMLEELDRGLSHLDTETASKLLAQNSIVAGNVRGYRQLELADEFVSGEFVIESRNEHGEVVRSIRPPYQLGVAPAASSLPGIGSHSRDVLKELGRSDDEIDDLVSAGVVGVSRATN